MGAPQFGNQILGDAVEKEFRLGVASEIWKGSTPSAGHSGGAPLVGRQPGLPAGYGRRAAAVGRS